MLSTRLSIIISGIAALFALFSLLSPAVVRDRPDAEETKTAQMAADAGGYSAAAIAQAKKDGDAHLQGLRDAGIIGRKWGTTRVKGRPAAVGGHHQRPPSEPSVGSQPKILHLIRHGQGYHNLLGELYTSFGVKYSSIGDDLSENNPYRRLEALDPPLTEIGRRQVKALRPRASQLRPELVLVSPLSRATQTALIAFSHLVADKASDGEARVKFVAHEGLREQMGAHICDKSRGLEDIMAEFPHVDYSLVERIGQEDELWSDQRESMEGVARRAYDFMMWLQARPEAEVTIATHSAFLFTLLNAVIDTGELAEGVSSWFMTGEMRSVIVTFEDETP